MESISYINRETGFKETELVASNGMLKWLYNKPLGKLTLHMLFKRKCLSAIVGWFMDTRISRAQIKPFIDRCQLDLGDYQVKDYNAFKTFNEFFYRKINPDKRPVKGAVVSPADCRLLAFKNLSNISSFFIKGSEFTIESFIENKMLAEKYDSGSMVIARLAPTDYHRFHFPASGIISESQTIKGKYFSVSPIALKQSLNIFCQNKREYSILSTTDYGDVLICEVGATMVGSIIQTYKSNQHVIAGQEKGYFAFGGSTIVMFFEKDKVNLADDLLSNTSNGYETLINMGDAIID